MQVILIVKHKMYIISIRKKSSTKTINNSYDILLKKHNCSLPIGLYNQNKNTVSLDLESYIFAISKGCKVSEKFKNIFLKTTLNIINKKTVKIIF